MVIQTGSAKVNNGEDRKAVLLLHGLGVYGESWWHQIQALREHGYFPLAPDLPGFGATPAGQGRWSVKNAAASAIKVLDQIGIDKAVVCGLSMGGVVALQLAIEAPERLDGLILINTFSALRPASLSEVLYFVRRGLRAYLRSPGDQAELVADRVFPLAEHAEWRNRLVHSIQASDPKVYRQSMLALARYNANRQLAGIQIPTMVITGTRDSTIPPRVQERMAGKIPGARQHLIDGAGHGVIIDHAETVNQLMLDFLAEIYPPTIDS